MEEKIGLKDILALAMKGYKLQDIKELVELANTVNAQGSEPEHIEPQPDPDIAPDKPVDLSDEDKPEKMPTDAETELLKEIERLKATIKDLQADNTKKDIQGEVKSDEERFEDLVKNFY